MSRWDRVKDQALPGPMGIGMRDDGRLVLAVNPQRCGYGSDGGPVTDVHAPDNTPWSVDELVAVLEHEAGHVTHGHITRRRGRDALTWNQACDLTLNPDIKNLPRTGLLPEQFGLPIGKTADWYYTQLLDQRDDSTPPSQGGSPDQGDGSATAGSNNEASQHGESSTNSEPGERDAPTDASNAVNAANTPLPGGIDSHESWDDGLLSKNPSLAKAYIDRAVKAAVRDVEAIHGERARGHIPGHIQEALAELPSSHACDWRTALHRRIAPDHSTGKRTSFRRRNRRYPDFPGKVPVKAGTVVALVDTSGSHRPDELALAWRVIQDIARVHDVVAVTCDTRVHDVFQVDPDDDCPIIRGRGGTNFQAAFDLIDEGSGDHDDGHLLGRASHVVIFTDGGVKVPTAPFVNAEVTWVIPSTGSAPRAAGGDIQGPIIRVQGGAS